MGAGCGVAVRIAVGIGGRVEEALAAVAGRVSVGAGVGVDTGAGFTVGRTGVVAFDVQAGKARSMAINGSDNNSFIRVSSFTRTQTIWAQFNCV
jgi:hypothetical protein